MYKKNKGFTIVELIVVMAIIAILVIMAVPTMQKYIKNAQLTYILATADTIHKAALAYEADHLTDPNFLQARHAGYIVDPSDWTKFTEYKENTGIYTAKSYLDPYIDPDVLFLSSPSTNLLNDSDIYDVFYVGTLPMSGLEFKDPILVYYNDPRMPTATELSQLMSGMGGLQEEPEFQELIQSGKFPMFDYMATCVVNGEPMVLNNPGMPDCIGNKNTIGVFTLVPVSKYLEEYNKMLKKIDK